MNWDALRAAAGQSQMSGIAEVRLGDVARLVNGMPYDSKHFGPDGERLIRIRDILGGGESLHYDGPALTRHRVTDGALLVGMDGDFNVARWAGPPALLNQRVLAVEADPVSSKWIEYCLPTALKITNDLTYATTVKHLSSAQVAAFRLPWPSRESRRQIADYLDYETAEIDAFIADLTQLSQLEIDRVRSDQELAITAAAPVIAIRRLSPVRVSGVSVNASQDPAIEGQVGVLKTSAVSRGYFRPEENKAVVDADEIARLAASVMGDRVLINRANTPSMVGAAAYVEKAFADLYLSDKIWSLDFDADNEYVWRALQTRYYREQVELSAVGASTSMQNLGYEDFLSVRLPVPCITEQRRIAIRLRSTWGALQASLADIDAAIALAKERRAALITAAVTGQIDVTAKQPPAVNTIETAVEEAR